MLTVTFGLCQQQKQSRFGARLRDLHLPPFLVVRVSRGAQSTVDGFYGTHTKNSPTALNVRRGAPGWEGFWTQGDAVARMAEIGMSLQPPGDVPHERTWRDINQQDVLYCITATSLF